MGDKDRLPPGQYLTRDLPVMTSGGIPPWEPGSWNLKVHGLVATPFTLDREEFDSLPRVSATSDLHCVATVSIYDLTWEGVLARELIERAHPLPEARFVLVHADGGYTANLPLEDLRRDDVLLADRLAGEPLPRVHGFPLRLVVPHRYAYKSVKWVRALEIVREDAPGFWESRGYSNSADPWREERFAPLPEGEPTDSD